MFNALNSTNKGGTTSIVSISIRVFNTLNKINKEGTNIVNISK